MKHPDADLLNKVISIKKGTVNRCLLELSATGGLEGMTVQKLAEIIKGKLDPSYAEKRKKPRRRPQLGDVVSCYSLKTK